MDKFLFCDLVAMEDNFRHWLIQIIQLSAFSPASSEMLCVHGTLSETDNIMDAAIFIHLIHYFAAKVTEVAQS